MTLRSRRSRVRATVLLLVSIVIFAGCGSTDSVTDGGGTDASSVERSTVPPGQTDNTEALTTASTEPRETPETSVTKPVEPEEILPSEEPETEQEPLGVTTGAARSLAEGFSEFSGLEVGLIANRASVVEDRSLIDLMVESENVELVAIFAPEHGLRADAGAGELVADGLDPITGLPVVSLYGETRKPSIDSLEGIDILVYDLQDVGARFYTYTATMGLAMQAAAEAGIPFVVLDRPNPIGGAIAGSVRTPAQDSFVSQYPIPSLHGMTSGELAMAIKGEGWLPGLESLDLSVVSMTGWTPELLWDDTGLAWVPPSPGLPTSLAALTYPSTVLFEATTLSYGRGTRLPFQQVGAPWLDALALAETMSDVGLAGVAFEPVIFTPVADELAANPQYEGIQVEGVRVDVTDGRIVDQAAVAVHLLAAVLSQAESADGAGVEVIDRGSFLDLLTGTTAVREALLAGVDPAEIVQSWQAELAAFEAVRQRYRLY